MDDKISKLNIRKLNISSAYLSISKNKLLIIGSVLVMVAIFFYFQYQKMATELKKIKSQTTTQGTNTDEVKKLVTEISKVARLPQDETPSVATITDVSKLKDQPFFKDAKNGDILLVFQNSGKAILYDPKEKKIVDITSLANTPAFNQQFKVAIRNGTTTSNLVSKLEEELKNTLGVINIVSKENANKNTYEKTIVIVLNKQAQEFASNVARSINAQIEQMSEDEPKPNDADILIIIGKDRASS